MPYSEKLQNNWTADSRRLFVTTSPFGRQTFFYPQEVGKFCVLPGYSVEREGYESFFLLATISGKGSLEYEGKKYALQPGTVAWIDCNVRHRYCLPAGESSWEFYWLHFYGGTAKGYYRQFRSGSAPVLQTEAASAVQEGIRELISLEECPRPQKEALSSLCIARMLTGLLCSFAAGTAELRDPPPFLRDMADEIERRYGEYLSLTYFAGKHHVNPSYLSREFRRFFGISFKQYLLAKRLSGAKEYLKYSRMSVGEIAERTGFETPSYFVRIFKRAEGISPLAFRRKSQ